MPRNPGVASINGRALCNAASNAGPCPVLMERIADSIIMSLFQRRFDLFGEGLQFCRLFHLARVQPEIRSGAPRDDVEMHVELALAGRWPVALTDHAAGVVQGIRHRI